MATEDDDPYVRAGRAVTSGAKPAAPAAEPEDPYVAAGRAVTAASTGAPALQVAGMDPESLSGSPTAWQNFGAGALQGVRDLGQTVLGWARQGDEAVPALGAIDRFIDRNIVPFDPAKGERTLADQTKASEAAHAGSTAYSLGRVGGNVAATTPFLPVGLAGRGAAAVGEMAAPWVGRLASGVTSGAVAGGGTSALTSGPSGQNPLEAAKEGATVGAAFGGAMPVVRTGINALSGRGGTALRNIADRLGIDLTTGQQLGGVVERVEDASKILPGSGAAAAVSRQSGQVAQTVAREAGIPGPVAQLTTPMLNQAETRIGDAIDNAARRITVPGDNTLLNTLGQIEANARVAGADAPQARAVGTLIDRIMATITNRGGNMPGADFQRFIARGQELDSAMNSGNGDVARAARAVREALLDAAERSGGGSADAVGDLQNARRQWKVVQTVRPAIDQTAGGSEGMSPLALARSIAREFDMSRTGPGNNMQDLARLLQGTKELRSSGTAERAAMYGALGIGGGGGAWYYAQHPEEVDDYLQTAAPYVAAGLLAGRASRFGPGFGVRVPQTVAQTFNPLAPRVAGAVSRKQEPENALAPR